jgi:hypothetical protein
MKEYLNMTTDTDTNATRAARVNGWMSGRLLATCGAAAALALMPAAAPAAPPALPSPAPLTVTMNPQAGGATESSYSMVVNDNGRVIKLEMKNNIVTHAEIDGATIPDDRIENDGEVVRLKDEKGNVLYEHELPRVGAGLWDPDDAAFNILRRIRPEAWSWSGGLGGVGGVRGSRGGLFNLSDPGFAMSIADDAEPPAVMMGVQMGVPDSTICGHLGLERDKVTLVTAVHEGLPAALAGLEPYDLIVAINGSADANPAAVRAALKDKKPGETLTLSVIHKGARKDVTLNLEAYDRKKLNSSKTARIAAGDDNSFFIATAPSAPIPPVPPTIPEEYRKAVEEYGRAIARGMASPQALTFRRGGGLGGFDVEAREKMLEELMREQERAAARAEESARRLEELASRMAEQARRRREAASGQGGAAPAGSIEQIQDQIRRMEEMLQKLMNEKDPQANPEQPKAKDVGTQT